MWRYISRIKCFLTDHEADSTYFLFYFLSSSTCTFSPPWTLPSVNFCVQLCHLSSLFCFQRELLFRLQSSCCQTNLQICPLNLSSLKQATASLDSNNHSREILSLPDHHLNIWITVQLICVVEFLSESFPHWTPACTCLTLDLSGISAQPAALWFPVY